MCLFEDEQDRALSADTGEIPSPEHGLEHDSSDNANHKVSHFKRYAGEIKNGNCMFVS